MNKLALSEDVRKLNPGVEVEIESAPASKYHNVRTEVAGLTFQSGKEATGIKELMILEEQHEIFGLRLQVKFPLQGKTSYVADAVYLDKELKAHVIDYKGYETPVFKIKRKLFKEKYGMDIEVR